MKNRLILVGGQGECHTAVLIGSLSLKRLAMVIDRRKIKVHVGTNNFRDTRPDLVQVADLHGFASLA